MVVDADSFRWTVMRDPEGGELCVLETRAGDATRRYEFVVDCADPQPIARWWADLLGGHYESDSARTGPTSTSRPGTSRTALAGATLLRQRDDEIGWHVLADPIPRATSSAHS